MKQRYIILDALRGFALLGIALANFPEFSLYTFQPADVQAAMPTAAADSVCRALLLFLVDGKFYTIFSLLFGIGFSIILSNAKERGASGHRIFYRRMTGLAIIGLLHLLFLWTGDILLLYALMGMLLPLFFQLTDKWLLRWSAFFLLLPILVDTVTAILGIDLSAPAYNLWLRWRATVGITEENFPTWLGRAESYGDVLKFVLTAAPERLYEFIDSNRYFKVLGLFLLGAYIGRQRVYARLDELRPSLSRWLKTGLLWSIPANLLYTVASLGLISCAKPVHTAIYTFAVYPLGLTYCLALCLLFLKFREARIWRLLSYPGKMALTNYLSHSLCGLLVFYGVGFGLGAKVGLLETLFITVAVYLLLTLLSALWQRRFQYGPCEWIWRMFTYGKYLRITKN